ncbi:MAG: sigma-70 family RNA polymerase sigma factor [Verrucomicrobia bacterium]|nr:sigma-70 family RNA polymerase sigma factor [Verrucomicrobiota bacterium]
MLLTPNVRYLFIWVPIGFLMTTFAPSLLDEFRRRRSEAAFAALVQRYSGLVFSTAQRRVGDIALAEDVAQAVFLRLARRPPEVHSEAELAGWLHQTTLHASIDHWRTESRRRARETAASTMVNPSLDSADQIDWTELAPHLDEAVHQLPEPDRQAVLLRFFEGRSMRELGESLGVSEAAAKMRVSRALEKLRQILAAQGITCGAALLGTTLDERLIEPVPDTLVARWCATGSAALRGGGSASSWGVRSVLPSVTGFQMAVLVATVSIATWGLWQWSGSPEVREPSAPLGPRVDSEAIETSPSAPSAVALRRTTANAVNPLDLDDARRHLREVLNTPPSVRNYPPPALKDALNRFGDQLSEAMPILAEAARATDFETRVWAFSGIETALGQMHSQSATDQRAEALSLARPILGAVLLEGRAAGSLRTSALMGLLPMTAYAPDGSITSPPVDEESLGWIERALHATPEENRDDGFRYTIIDLLVDPRRQDPAIQQVIRGLEPMLAAPSPEDRLVAAYGLAMGVDDPPASVQAVLLTALRETSTHSYRAARALGNLGPEAASVVPELLRFAEKTADLASGGYSRNALESACRLKPELRSAYPEIDQSLKLQEIAYARMAQEKLGQSKSSREQILELAAAGDEVVLRALTGSIQRAPDAHTASQQMEGVTRMLETEMASAPADERVVLERVLGLVRATEIRPDPPANEQPAVDVRNLLLDARIALNDLRHPGEGRIEQALQRFQSEQVDTGKFSTVTPESFAALAKILEDIDPKFRADWQKTVLEENPGLDRVISKVK